MGKDKAKHPKVIAGVKVPKELRKAGAAAKDFINGPIGSDLVSAALIAAAASLSKSKAGKAVGRSAQDAASDTAEGAAAIGNSVKKALIDAARHLLDSFEDGPVRLSATPASDRPVTPKAAAKRKSSKADGRKTKK